MLDGCGRTISYLRLSITDRCNFRCRYCLPENADFEKRSDLLSISELVRLSDLFIGAGIRKIRITGGEPLVRGIAVPLVEHLGSCVRAGAMDEVVMTTNGFFLSRYAKSLATAGMSRINVSLDTLDDDLFRDITGHHALDRVINGIDQALDAGLNVKVNCVVQKGVNDQELDDMVLWCGERGLDLTLIETMPIGVMGHLSMDRYLPLTEVQGRLAMRWTLSHSRHQTGGPARYMRIAETGCRVGFITPQSHNFCGDCNRVRMTSTGKLYPCLGHEHFWDFRSLLRGGAGDQEIINTLKIAFSEKPKGHGFGDVSAMPPSLGHEKSMALTGG